MANELVYSGDPASDSALTIDGRVYGMDGVQVSSDVTMTEVGVLAIYRGDMPIASAGQYIIKFYDGVNFKQQFRFLWDGSNEVTVQTLSVEITAMETSLNIAVEDAALLAR